MNRSVAEKMGVKAGMRAYFVGAPQASLEAIELPDLVVGESLSGMFDYIHFFAIKQDELDEQFPKLKEHLSEKGKLWISWPKGRKMGTDLTLTEVIRIGYTHGLVESTALRVDDTWAGIKFTHPIAGKVYNNKYGTLPE